MSFIQEKRGVGLVRDMFPERIARNTTEDTEWMQMTIDMYVPHDFDGLFDWAQVKEIPRPNDPSRKWEVVHKIIHEHREALFVTPSYRRVTIRLFGVLGNFNFMELGNWNRTEAGAAKAIQFLTLRAGPFPEQFERQKHVLSDLRRMVHRMLGENDTGGEYRGEELFFHRRAFTKVNGPSFHRPLMAMDDSDVARLGKMSSRWVPSSPAAFGKKTDHEDIRRCHPALFNQGDFLDVTACFDIASVGKFMREKHTKVHFAFTRVVRLLTAAELMNVTGESDDVGQIEEIPIVYEDKLAFEDDVTVPMIGE